MFLRALTFVLWLTELKNAVILSETNTALISTAKFLL
jgi:hypothetical protein